MVVYGIQGAQARKLAYPLLARAAKLHWNMNTLPDMERAERGKPFFPSGTQYQFNVSHSGEFAVCALDREAVGVDIQIVQKRRQPLIDRVCSPQERQWLRRRGDRAEDFTLLWAMKESRCKHSGEGLRQPISAISVPLPEDGETLLEWEGLRFYLAAGEGWRFSLCGSGVWDRDIHWLDAETLKYEEINHDSTGM